MIDDIAEIAVEAAGELAIAVGGSAAKEEKEKRRKKKFSLVAPIIGILLILGILYIQFWRFGMFKESGLIIDEVGYVGAIAGLVGGLLILLIAGLFMMFSKKQKEKNKPLKRIYFLILVSSMITVFIVYSLYTNLEFVPMKIIPLIAFTFGITLMFIMLFDSMRKRTLKGFAQMGSEFMIRVTIPMLPLQIILLGALSSKYNYPSIFLNEVSKSIGIEGKNIGGIIGQAFYKVIEKIFNLGVNRPSLWIFLIIAAFLVLIYSAIRKSFLSEEWPYGCEEDPESKKEAQYFIDKAEDKFLSREDLNAFKRGKLRLNKTILDKLEKKEKGVKDGGTK